MHNQSGARRMLSQLVHDVPVVGVASTAATAAASAAIVIDVIGTVALDGVFVDMVGAESGQGWFAACPNGTTATAADRRLFFARRRPT